MVAIGIGAGTAHAQVPEPTPEKAVVKVTKQVPPKHVKRTVRYTPPADIPSTRSAVLSLQAKIRQQHGGPNVINRVACETGGTYNDDIVNPGSGATGLGQWIPSSWANFGLPTRSARWYSDAKKKRAIVRTTFYFDGSSSRERIGTRVQEVRTFHVGRLPASPPASHAYANLLKTIVYAGATSWDCGL